MAAIWTPDLVNASMVTEEPIYWLWENKIPLNMVSILAGRQGGGKTFLTCYMAAMVSNGWNWADSSPCPLGSVLFFYGEDVLSQVLIPRLKAQGAALYNICILDSFKCRNSETGEIVAEKDISLKMVDGIRVAIEETAAQTGLPVKLVIIDPVSNFWGGTKENDNAEVRETLKPITRIAEEMECTFLLTTHFSKAVKIEAANKMLGSTAISAYARTVWYVYPSPDTPQNRLFIPTKSNCLIDPSGVEFLINKNAGGRVEIVNTNVTVTADELEARAVQKYVAERKSSGRKPLELESAKDWLLAFLADGAKPAGSAKHSLPGTIHYESAQAGHSWRTLSEAKSQLKVSSNLTAGCWKWELPCCQNSPS